MHITTIVLSLSSLLAVVGGIPAASWPYGPLSTSGRWIVNSLGSNVTYAGVNWPGAADAMVPEGLQYASIASIVSKVKELGMNVIRLTYAIEMIDDILDNGGDVSLRASLVKALGDTNGNSVFNAVLKNNPSFASTISRLQVVQFYYYLEPLLTDAIGI